MPKILIIGAGGQIGSELVPEFRKMYGDQNVVASDIRPVAWPESGEIFEILDATDKTAIEACIKKYGITDVYLMAALLSATSEKYPDKAWRLNMNSLLYVLELAKEGHIEKIFWPSSIAIFGPSTPKENTPQHTVTAPSTVYGISKLAGERWCEYYHKTHNVDVRSIRYPGLISWKTPPGGGTTDYAVDIYHKAVTEGCYECFLKSDTTLPMMFMEDAINATTAIMQAGAGQVKVRSSYNIAAVSFSPADIAASIQKHIPGFTIAYKPDSRQHIADSWPKSIDDSEARAHWGWQHRYGLEDITSVMLSSLRQQHKENAGAL